MATPLTTLEYRITGVGLRVTPAVLSVPKGVAGSVLVEMSGGLEAALAGAFVEATLRGPSFPARRVIGQVNQPLVLPPLPIVGDYQLDNIRLVRVEGANTITLQEGSPSSVPIHVFDEVLVSRVTSRPLTLDEIREKGIVIDDKNFRVVEFEVGFVLDGKTIPVRFPVVAPAFAGNTEIIPAAELERRLAEAEAINNQIDLGAVLPKELETARLNIDIKGINFQVTEEFEQDLALQIPAIPALMVIPGNVGFLNQFFSVQIFTENAAPQGSGLSVINVQALLKLPPGPDLLVSTNYNAPGDDPLRFARVGSDKIIQPVQPVVRPGADGKTGTSDDIPRLLPGEAGTGEFLVEGLQEGLHVMDLDLTADLEGLAAGIVKIKGKAAGSVLVRNPKFSLAFSHPRTVRAGEPYDLYVTILNTGSSVANLVQVAMAAASISGGNLESAETVVLGTILPGQTATAKFRIRATQTGAISFSNLTTSDDSLVGRFRLRGGFDERGVALSPDTIAMPSYVTNLPPALIDAANRVLGQALSVATAGQLPANVKPIGKSVVTRRVLELAEAGQRVQYGDPLPRVLADVLLDWQGARNFNAGFDQIIRETDAGREWREAVTRHQDLADGLNAITRLAVRLPDMAGRGEPWAVFALDAESGTIRFGDGVNGRLPPEGTNNLAPRYDHTNASSGLWFVERPGTNLVFEWKPDAAVASAQLAFALIETNGTAQQMRWTVTGLSAGACVRYSAGDASGQLLIDNDCDGTNDTVVAASIATVNELPPALVSVRQDPSVLAGRPAKLCVPTVPGFPLNYGTVLAVLFSKPMTQDRVNVPTAYTMENGNVAGSVQIQPGGRVALLNMRQPLGALRSRTMTVSGVTDPRGSTLLSNALPVLSDLRGGVSVRGRVARGDGSPAAGVPVTLTYYDLTVALFDCPEFIVRPAQVFTDESGFFDFDFVVSGIPYSISATDTLGLSAEAIQLILESTRADEFQRSKLLELANSRSAQNTLLADFAVGTLTDVVAKAEGLDRALLRDFIGIGSSREGTEVPVALRFRGRGAVAGRVVSSDGVTPVSRVAVNLFPDPASRELGRGLFTDGDGRVAFFGVPLGIFSIEANSGTGLSRTVAGVIEQPGQTTNVLIVLSSAQVPRTDLTGRVTESDNSTPHPNATVFVGEFVDGIFKNVVAAVAADSDGYWRAPGIPADLYDLVAVSLDGKRKGERRAITAPPGVTNFASVSLQGFGVVIGRVETAGGTPVVNAIVAGGERLVRTTNNGFFRLTGVPTGLRIISAGAERSSTNGAITTPPFSFPRLGSAGVNVLPGVENFVVIRFEPKGSLIGRVVDETGTNAVTGINVALPEQGGFQWVPVNDRGEFAFEGIALKRYTVSAPAPAVFDTDVSGLLETISDRGSSEGEIQAAIGEAFAIFTGAADPLLNGEGAAFNPNRWGYIETELVGDGEVRNVTVQFFRSSIIAGKVLNGQGVPIGARVRLTGVGPALNGGPVTVIRGERNSDPALGTFSFERQAFIGSYGLQTASPFYPIVVVRNGFTTEIQPDDTNVVLQFPSARDVNGRLAGQVFNPDGSPAGADVNVKISFGTNYVIKTRADGTFDTQIGLPALQLDGTRGKGYFVEAEDPVTGARGAANVTVMPGNTNVAENIVNIRLLGRGALRVTVLENDGTPAAGASLGYFQGNYPSDNVPLGAGPVTDASGQALFLNLFEGFYSACARFVSGPTTLRGTTGVSVQAGTTNDVIIRLGPTGTIEGYFVKRDQVTPVGFAQIAVGSIGFATTASNGFFRVGGLPLGTYRLTSFDPVTGVGATLSATLSFDGQTNIVRLIEQSRGEIRGAVIASDGTNLAPGVNVTLTVSDGITPSRTVTTGPDGRFGFPGAAAGPFELFAQHPVTRLTGANRATLPENATVFEINVALQPLAAVTIAVLRPDGFTPATNTSVMFGAVTTDTDSQGRASFSDLRLGDYTVTATSRTLSETHSVARTNINLLVPGQAPEVVMVLAGVGRVNGQVFLSNGSNAAVGAFVTLSHLGDIARYSLITGTDANGQFVISNVAVGPYEVSARSGPLGARVLGSIVADGEVDTLSLTLEPSGTAKGRLVRADGVTPVSGEDVNLTLPGRGLPGSLFRTGTNGLFEFTSLPLGLFRLQSTALGFNGIALREATLSVNGETNDVGTLMMDEDDPRVVSAFPADTAVGVPITTRVELVFNETLRSNTVDVTGVYLQGPSNTVAATVQLLNHSNGVGRLVRLTPLSPLRSLTTYRVVVVDNIRQDAFGAIIGRGPQDLVGRPLVAPFLATFTTADNDPPLLLSIFPTNGQIQIDPRAVMRLSFNEPIRETNFSLTLTGTNGLVPGATSVGLNGLVLAFAPAAELAPNTAYTLAVSNIFDLAGNRATNEPFVATFATLDTLGPEIAAFSIVSNRPPVAGSTVQVEALLAVNEPGVSIRFTQNLSGAGSDTNAPFRVNVTLPATGTTTVRAIATDRFGNDGPLAEFIIAVVSNEPPSVTLTRVEPASGPVFRAEPFTVRVNATDDASVTNIVLTVFGAVNAITNLPGTGPVDVTLFVPSNAATGSVLTVRAQAADFAGLLSPEVSLDLVVSNLNHRPVTLAGAGGAGNALRFDGVNDFVSVANSPSVNPTAAITLEAWVFAENLNSSQIGIAGTWDDNAGGFRSYLFWIQSGRLEFLIAPTFARPVDSITFPLNRWVHVAATYDGAVVRLYRDGTNIASVASSGPIASNSRPFFIGRTEGGSNGPDFFPGSIDEVRLWNRALSPTEIAELRSRALIGNEPGLVGYWPFNEGTGTTAADLTANNNVGTLGAGNAASQPIRVVSTAPISGVAISTNTSLPLLPLALDGSDPDGDPITAIVATLPAHGTLFQTADGITPGAAITNVPATVSSTGRIVLFRRQPGFTGRDQFSYRLNDGVTNSAEGLVQLELVTPAGLDTDGDGMPDGYEFANGFNPEANDASLDADSDGLNNLAEFQAGTNPRNPDTDGDGLPDGSDPNPLLPSNGIGLGISTYASVIDPVQLSFAPDGTLFAGRDNTGSTNTPTASGDPVRIHRIGAGGAPVAAYGNAAIADPDGVAFDATGAFSGTAGSVLVAGSDGSGGFIRAIKPDQSIIPVFGPSGSFGNPQTIKLDRNGRLLFMEPSVQKGIWASTGGAPALLIPLAAPQHMAVGSDNRIFVSDQFGRLGSYLPNGTTIDNAFATGLPAFNFDVAPGGFFGTNIWGVDANGRLLEVNPVSGAIAERATGLGDSCYDAVFGPDGALYISQFDQDRILRVGHATCTPLPNGAVAWWRGEDNALDATGLNHGGLSNGVAFANGRVGRGFRFDGANDFIEVPNTSALNPATITLEAWVNPAAITDGSRIISKDLAASSCAAPHVAYSLSVRRDRGNRATFHFTTTNDNVLHEVNSTSVIPTNAFTQLAATFDGSVAKIYINGVLENSVVVAGTLRSTTTPLVIGNGAQGCRALTPGNVEFNGVIDEVAIYSRSLTAAEVQSLFAASSLGKCPPGCAPIPPGAVAWWRAESNALDSVGANNGVLTNGATFAAGKVGMAFGFGGVEDGVRLTGSKGGPLDLLGNQVSIEAWILLTNANQPLNPFNAQVIFDKYFPGGYMLFVHEGRLSFNVNTVANADFTMAAPQTLPLNQYVHVTGTYDGTAARLYVNGNEVAGVPLSGNIVHNDFDAAIGNDSGGSINFGFRGSIDEVTVYARALPDAEMRAIAAAGSAGKCPSVCAPLPPSAIAWWPGQDNAADALGTNDGVLLNGVTFTTGVVGRAFQFDGVSTRVTVADAPAFRFTSGLTMETWFRTDGTPDFSGLIDKFEQQAPETTGFQLSFHGNAGRGTLRSDLGIGTNYATVLDPRFVMDGLWHHAAVTWNGAQILLYVDGVPGQPVNTTNVQVILQNTEPLILGWDNGSGGRNFNGDLDEVTLYSRALTAAEIQAIYLANLAGKCPPACVPAPANLAAWWPGNDSPDDLIGGIPGSPQNGASFTNSGFVGSAFRLDGVDDYLDIGPLAAIDNASELTVAAWVNRFSNVNDPRQGIIGKWNTGGGGNNTFLLYNGEGSQTHRGGFAIAFANGTEASTGGTTAMDTNRWYHLAVTWRSADGRLIFFKNGIHENASTAGAGQLLRSHRSYTAKIGEWGILRDARFKWPGLIDEVMVFNRALGSNEIAAIVAAGSLGVCVPQCSPAPAGLASWWRGEDNALDAIGVNNGTLLGGVGFEVGVVQRAFVFDGVNDLVSLGTASSFRQSSALTYAFWTKLPPGGGGNVMGVGAADGQGLGGVFVNSNQFAFLWTPSSPVADANVAAQGIQLPSNQWVHLAVAMDFVSQTRAMYVNGQSVPTTLSNLVNQPIVNWVPNSSFNSGRPDFIGGRLINTQSFFRGSLDEVDIYSRSLTAAEVLALFNAGIAGKCVSAGPFAELRLEAGLRVIPGTGGPGGTGPQVIFNWSGQVGAAFAVEASSDLIHWVEVPAMIREVAPGRYEGSMVMPNERSWFFRVSFTPR